MVGGPVVEALRFQRRAVEHRSLASPLYATVLDAVIGDVEAGGPCAEVLSLAPPKLDPIADALVLRFLGAVHRLVLGGHAPDLAAWYPSAGGSFTPGREEVGRIFVATVDAHRAAVVAGLAEPVQTNEVGRAAALAVGFTELLRRFRLPLRLLEVGASAGLNLRWDRWRYEAGPTAWGRGAARLRFAGDAYRAPLPNLDAPLGPDDAVAARLGCDQAPIDATTPAGAVLLRSFVWPDQTERLARLDAALAEAAEVPVEVEEADAGAWVRRRLAEAVPGTTSVVAHSIVWQYLPSASRDELVEALRRAGNEATPDAPLAWLRMEPPADPSRAAELWLSTWSGGAGDERLLARSGYHGRPVSAVS